MTKPEVSHRSGATFRRPATRMRSKEPTAVQHFNRRAMVLLTMTPALVAAVEEYSRSGEESRHSEPSLADPKIGNPISHGQVIDISRALFAKTKPVGTKEVKSYHLNDLLKGSYVYLPPPAPRSEPTSEYKELMARLRRDEEARTYQKMTYATSKFETSLQASTNTAVNNPDIDDDEMTYADVNRQMILILNVLVSIVACGIAIWIIARSWNAPARLALSMCGSGGVGIAEVVIYAGYIRRLKEAKTKERSKKEKKQVIDTWTTDAREGRGSVDVPIPISARAAKEDAGIKFRGKQNKT